jgi:hypothetical protein
MDRLAPLVTLIKPTRISPAITAFRTPRGSHAVAALLTAYALVRVYLLRSTPVNSDEPQHLHVVWGWSQGLVPYRDVFDNHTPLFHMLYAPLLRMLGETPDVLLWMRLAIVPVAVAAIALTAVIARQLWNRQVALWAIVFACTYPPYLLVSGQFRTDGLWAMAWIATIATAVCGRWTLLRAASVGVLIGATFAVSMKTTLLLSGLVLAWGFVQFGLPARVRPSALACVKSTGAMLAGVIVIPAFVVGIVAAKGGLAAMRYGVIEHNLLPRLGRTHGHDWRIPLMLVLLALLGVAVRRVVRSSIDPLLSARRCLVIASALAYTLLLFGTWPLLTRQDYLPSIPLLAIGLAGWWQARHWPRLNWLPIALVIAGLLSVLHKRLPWDDRIAPYRASLADVLAVTSPGEPVMDDKGASVYRRRPYYFALEGITQARIQRGLIVDDIPQRLIATNTHVLWMERLPAQDRAFIAANYLPVRNGLRVAGHDFGQMQSGMTQPFEILLPGDYVVTGPASGASIDGNASALPRMLSAGRHILTTTQPGHVELVWRPAALLLMPPTQAH